MRFEGGRGEMFDDCMYVWSKCIVCNMYAYYVCLDKKEGKRVILIYHICTWILYHYHYHLMIGRKEAPELVRYMST